MSLPIYEIFHSWQGEGCHTGRSAFFIRTFGCPVKCPWCDSAGTWHPDFISEKIERIEVAELVEAAAQSKAEFVVVTGGEPTIYNLTELTNALHEEGLPVHLETSGAFPIRGQFDWITLSPKWQKMPLEENLKIASEFKLIIETPDSMRNWTQSIGQFYQGKAVWLHPEWSQRESPAILSAITSWVKEHGAPYRAGWQLHKHYAADADDARAREEASLAGN